MNHFPIGLSRGKVSLEYSESIIDDLLPTCDDGAEKIPASRPAYQAVFIYPVEQGLVQIHTRGTPARFV